MLHDELLGGGAGRNADLAAILLSTDALAGLAVLAFQPVGVAGAPLALVNVVVLLAAVAVWRGGRHLPPPLLKVLVVALFVSSTFARALLGPVITLGARAVLVFVWLGITDGGVGMVAAGPLMALALLGGGLAGRPDELSLQVAIASLPTWLIVGCALAIATRLHRGDAESLAHRALHDPLTGVANRELLTRRLGAALHSDRIGDGGVAVLYVDLDDFKKVNDTYGHAVGDAVLAAIGRRLVSAVRPADLVARVGGDEFVVLCNNDEAGHSEHMRERIEEAVRSPIAVGHRTIRVGVSVGVHTTRRAGQPAHEVLAAADSAMYARKRAGRSTA